MDRDELLGNAGARALSSAEIAELYREHHLGGLTRVASLLGANLEVVDAEGAWLKLADGSQVLDCQASNGAVAFGHRNPALLAAARAALDTMAAGLPSLLPSRGVAALCHDLVSIAPTGMSHVVLYNSGAESIEGALVLATLAQGERAVFVGFEGGFHGKSAGARGVGGIAHERNGFPPWATTEILPYGDLAATRAFLDREGRGVAAVVVEPIQSNSGVRIPPSGFLAGLAEACRRAGALLVLDEVSTGLGRTGRMFACQWEDVVPDILCLSKALSGGLVPVGAVLVNDGLSRVLANPRMASHFSTTFAGGQLVTSVALEVVRLLSSERMHEKAEARGLQLEEGLRGLASRHPRLVRDVRGRGLLWGIELADPADLPMRFLPQTLSSFLASRFGGSLAIAFQRYLLRHHRVLLAPTAANRSVVRIFPPLVAEDTEIQHLLTVLDEALAAGPTSWVRTFAASR
jgi:putrescine aminotransferase